MNKPKSRTITVLNVLGSLGYVACLLQWLWMIMILLPSIIESPVVKLFAPNTTTPLPPVTDAAPISSGSVPLVVTTIALVIGVSIVIGAIYVIVIKFPRSVAKTGETITHSAAAIISPVITEHIPMPAKQRRTMPMLVIIVIKLLCVFAPLCLLLFAQGLSLAMSFDLIMVIGIVLFSWSFLAFAFQFILSQLLKVNYKTIH